MTFETCPTQAFHPSLYCKVHAHIFIRLIYPLGHGCVTVNRMLEHIPGSHSRVEDIFGVQERLQPATLLPCPYPLYHVIVFILQLLQVLATNSSQFIYLWRIVLDQQELFVQRCLGGYSDAFPGSWLCRGSEQVTPRCTFVVYILF